MNYKFRTKAACRIAGIDHQRFNEDVAAGEYPHAPVTTAGVSRVFDEADIAGLYVYAHLTRGCGETYRFSKRSAATYAGGVIQALRGQFPLDFRQVRSGDRARADFPLVPNANGAFIRAFEDHPPHFKTGVDQGVVSICFDLEGILEIVRRRMEEEARILGEED